MPVYENKCNKCNKHLDIYRTINERNDNLPECCGVIMERVISAPRIINDIQPYQAMAIDKETGKAPYITSKSQHRDFLKKNGYVEIGNDLKAPKERTEIRGDFNNKKELVDATQKALANPKNYY